mmetsp:Transcript_21340/g.36423  ORF Transcript_21340/g.36423 Transcript_21340/m.36423 type:complete len:99 (-) Transcript_21340:35-331(-)
MRLYHDELLRNGIISIDIDYKRIGYNKALVTIHIESADRNTINQFLITIKDKKIIVVRHVSGLRSIMKARLESGKNSLRRTKNAIRWGNRYNLVTFII